MALLTPSPYNETCFEHFFLAKTLAIPLVEGPDLTVRDLRVYLKTLEGLEQVDFILRRQDNHFCDPLELRGDSLLGIPGLLGAMRTGHIVIAIALGSGLIETPASKAFLPGLCRHLLGEELMLPSVANWWCGQQNERRYVLDHIIIKPAFPRFGLNPVFGPELDNKSREELRHRVESPPAHYVAQEMVSLSRAPFWTDEGLRPRHTVLRTFAACDGERFITLPGGLTRVALASNSFVVNMQRGGSSKDTWMLGRSVKSRYAKLQISGLRTATPALGSCNGRPAEPRSR